MEDYKDRSFRVIQNLFTLLIILYPIIGLYGSPFSGVTIADLLLILLLPLLFIMLVKLDWNTQKSICSQLLIFSIFIIFQLLIIMPITNSNLLSDMIMSSIRYLLYLLVLSLFGKTFFRYDYGLRLLRIVSVSTSIFLIIQFLVYKFMGLYLPGTISFLHFLPDTIDNLYYLYHLGYEIRVSSVFAEPAHFSTYVILFLIIDLMSEKKKSIEYIYPVIISIAVLFSRSSTGIIMCIFIWMLWILMKITNKDAMIRKLKFLVYILILLPSALFSLLNTNSFQLFLNRTFSNGHLGNAAAGRIGNIDIVNFISNNTVFHILMGKGLIDFKEYLPGFARLVNAYGLIGLTVFSIVIMSLFFKSNKLQKILITIFLILNIGTEIVFGNFILLYFPFIMINMREESNKIRENQM